MSSIPAPSPDGPSENARAVTSALDQMIRIVADACMASRDMLATCQLCRNHVLYLLDTEPYTGRAETALTSRVAYLPAYHGHSHARPEPADSDLPRIRGLA